MATVSILWHLHQPSYRTADGVAHAPWALLHAGGTYTTLARAILASGGAGQVVNIVPTLLEQLIAYRDHLVYDPVVEAIVRPASELGDAERATLISWAFHTPPRQMARYPRLDELALRRGDCRDPKRLDGYYGLGDLRDLQVLFVLSQAGDQAWRDERLAGVSAKGRHFSAEDHQIVADWLLAQPAELLALWRQLAETDGVELATSPYAHPIMPLLADTSIVTESWAPYPAPEVPEFRHPEDARLHLERALEMMREQGLPVVGCWPPEGSVSAEALAIYAEAGVRWLVTDEGILERSLGRSVRDKDHVAPELFRPWRLETPSPVLFFRDRWMSDRIGFTYANWDDEARAAADVVDHLRKLAWDLPDDAAIVLALDGENAWLHYPQAGGVFLRELMSGIAAHRPELEPMTLGRLSERHQPQALSRLHPGSWINSIFATWIGHPEKTAAWRVLASVREALAASATPQPPSLLLAEGSDWFWWLGDDNPTTLAPLYDRIFRAHLADACRQASIEPPVDLDKPLKTLTVSQRVPVAESWQAPKLDGRVTSYFEWSLAEWVQAGSRQPLRSLALWAGHGRLHLLVEGTSALAELVASQPLKIHLTPASGPDLILRIGTRTDDETAEEQAGVDWAVGPVVEVSMPWDGLPGARLEVRLGPHGLPEGAVLLLEPFFVDEEPERAARDRAAGDRAAGDGAAGG